MSRVFLLETIVWELSLTLYMVNLLNMGHSLTFIEFYLYIWWFISFDVSILETRNSSESHDSEDGSLDAEHEGTVLLRILVVVFCSLFFQLLFSFPSVNDHDLYVRSPETKKGHKKQPETFRISLDFGHSENSTSKSDWFPWAVPIQKLPSGNFTVCY